MDLSLTQGQRELLAWAESVLTAEASLDRFTGNAGPHVDTAVEKLAQLGWVGLALPEESGGAGMGAVEEATLMAQAGRHLPGPALLGTVIAAHAAAADADRHTVLDYIGWTKQAAVAMPSHGTGEIVGLDTNDAELIVSFGADAIVLVPASRLTAMDRPAQCLDDSLSFRRYTVPEDAGTQHSPGSILWLRAHLLLAALLIGAGEGAMAMAVEFAKTREQFGQPIGAFQAVKHKCSNMALHLAAARSQLSFAAAAFDEERRDLEFRVLSACALAESSATAAAFDNVQVHGGMGFTSECHAQRFVKRVSVLRMLGGVAKRHRAKLIVGAPPA